MRRRANHVVTGLEYSIPVELSPASACSVALPPFGANDRARVIVRGDLDHPRPMATDAAMLAGAR